MFPGFPTRVVRDLKAIFKDVIMKGKDYDTGIKIKVSDPFTRKHSVFIGGSMIAGFEGTQWVTKADYEEHGPNILGSSSSH